MSDLVKVNHIFPPEPFRVVKGGQQVQLIGSLSEALISKWGA